MSEKTMEVIRENLENVADYGFYYYVTATCMNCGERNTRYFLKGRAKFAFPCSNCEVTVQP